MRVICNESSKRSHLREIRSLLSSSDDIVICSGWMKWNGLSLLEDAIRRAVANGSSIRIYSNPGHTELRCIQELQKWGGIDHFMPVQKYFHSKVYYGRESESYKAIVGSANVTAGGLKGSKGNDEMSIFMAGKIGDRPYEELMRYFAGICDSRENTYS